MLVFMLNLTILLLLLIEFQNITGLKIVEIFKADSAFKSGRNFFDIIFETPHAGYSGIG